jgi:hypothetical protein
MRRLPLVGVAVMAALTVAATAEDHDRQRASATAWQAANVRVVNRFADT